MTPAEIIARALCIADGRDPDEDWTTNGMVTLAIAVPFGEHHRWRTYRRKAEAFLTALTSQGFAVVPVEPTEAMREAASDLVDQATSRYNFLERR